MRLGELRRAVSRHPLLSGAVLLFAVLITAYCFSVDLRATRGASITGDEPFYLLTTQSILEDGDLDLRQQYERESYRSFFDHPDGLWRQSVPLADGRLLSPHDPGLSIVLIPGFAVAGLRGAQVEMLLLGSLAFALAFVLVAKESGSVLVSWFATCAVALSATAFVYSTELYPEVPAAMLLVVALLVLRHAPGRWRAVLLVLLFTALAWLGVKYLPLAGIVAAFFVIHATGGPRRLFLALSAVSAFAYLWLHFALFGDLTAYSINTVYEGAPTFEVVRSHLALHERVYRLWGLFIDERFGIGRWALPLLIVPFGLPLLVARRGLGRTVAALIVAQVLIATFVAVTMMGWWFPGRTLVAVAPLFPFAIVAVVTRFPALRVPAAALMVHMVIVTAALAGSVRAGEITLAVDPFAMSAPIFRWIAPLFPSYTDWGPATVTRTVIWLVAAAVVLALVVTPGRGQVRPAPKS